MYKFLFSLHYLHIWDHSGAVSVWLRKMPCTPGDSECPSVPGLLRLWGTISVVGECGGWWKIDFASSQCSHCSRHFTNGHWPRHVFGGISTASPSLCQDEWGGWGKITISQFCSPASNSCWHLCTVWGSQLSLPGSAGMGHKSINVMILRLPPPPSNSYWHHVL